MISPRFLLYSWLSMTLAVHFIAIPTHAADWPQFLGPSRSGIADGSEKSAARENFSFKTLWTHPLGSGFAGPVVAQGKVIVFHRKDDQAVVEALDAQTGSPLWSFGYANDYQDGFGMDDGPRACPAVAGDRVIIHGAEGMVHALDLSTGKKLWSYDTVREAGSPQGFFGRACSPLVVGDRVIITPGGSNAKGPAGVVALSFSSGAPLWQSVEDEAGYASPMAHDGVVFCWMRNNMVALRPTDGSILCTRRLRSEMEASVNAAQPVWLDADHVFLTAGYGVGAHLWKWNGSSDFTEVWRKENVLDCHYSSPVHRDGCLYGFHGRQEFGQRLRCIRVSDGQVMWESDKVPGGTLLCVQDILLVLTESGELWAVAAASGKMEILAQEQILRAGHRSYGAYADGVFYARDGGKLAAVQVRPR